MYKNLILLTAVLAVFVSSCKKDENVKKCKTSAHLNAISYNGQNSTNLLYGQFETDDCGRLRVYKDNDGTILTILSRNAKGDIINARYHSGGIDRMVWFSYNSQHQVQAVNMMVGDVELTKFIFQYDAQGRVAVKEGYGRPGIENESIYVGTQTYTYTDSRICPATMKWTNGKDIQLSEYTYDDKINPWYDLEPQLYYLSVMPYAAANVTKVELSNNGSKYTTTTTYTYRADGLPETSNEEGIFPYGTRSLKYNYNK